MNNETLVETIKRELPTLLRSDPTFGAYLISATRLLYADRVETENRFDRVLDELRREREEQSRKWEEQSRKWEEKVAEDARKWEEQNRKWEEKLAEDARKWEEQNRKWDEQNRKWEEKVAEDARKWEEQNRKWDEQNRKWEERVAEDARKWEENQQELQRIHMEIMATSDRHDRSIGALGARWGTRSESAFRQALAAILEKSFGVKVLNINEFDDAGEVFGRPDQVELDILITNGTLLILELKSSMSRGDMYLFERKARFYEKRHQRKAERLIAVSPMLDPRAREVAKQLGIESYSDSLDVPV